MRKIIQRIVSLVIVFAFSLSLVSTAYAAENISSSNLPVDYSSSEKENAKAVYEGLTPEAKQIFLDHISRDPDLVQFHQENVDSTFSPQNVPEYSSPSLASDEDNPLEIIHNGLLALGLSTAVVYAFEGIASGIIASAADGFLPVGELYAIMVGTYAAAILATYWSIEVAPNWDGIVEVFQSAFSAMKENIADALDFLAEDAVSLTNPVESVAIHGNLIIVQHEDGEIERLQTSVRAENCVLEDNCYYAAALIDKILGICPIDISFATAVAIQEGNKKEIGVATYHHTLAEAVVTAGNPYGYDYHSNEYHANNPNYLPHYHPFYKSGALRPVHIWFVF